MFKKITKIQIKEKNNSKEITMTIEENINMINFNKLGF